MSSRILMATVAAIALAVPAAAQDQVKAPETEQGAPQQLEKTQDTMQKPSGASTEATEAQQAAEPTEAEQPAEPSEAEQPAMTAEEPAGQEVTEDKEATPPAEMAFIEVQDEAQFLANDEVIGKGVVNDMDEEVGTIADLVMDQDQKLVGVVLSVGGFLGIGDKWVAVPVDQIDFPTDDQPARLLAAVTKEQLENAPDFTTRDVIEAEQAASEAQQQMQQQAPAPATSTQ